jgi:hypothetical protein
MKEAVLASKRLYQVDMYRSEWTVFIVLLLLLLLLLSLATGLILPGNSHEPRVIPTAQASSFTLQYFLYYV